jgi:hypothetical protein
MTIEQLRNCSAAELQAMSREQLLEYFKPYLHITRPEQAEKPKGKTGSATKVKFDAANMMLKNLGIDFKL